MIERGTSQQIPPVQTEQSGSNTPAPNAVAEATIDSIEPTSSKIVRRLSSLYLNTAGSELGKMTCYSACGAAIADNVSNFSSAGLFAGLTVFTITIGNLLLGRYIRNQREMS